MVKNSLYIMAAGSLWGIISIFINILKDIGFNSLQCVAIRSFFTALFLFTYLLITDRHKLKIKVKDMLFFVGTGIGSIVFFNYCYFQAIEIIGGAAVPALLLYTAPVFVMVLSAVIFREKFTVKKTVSLIVTFIGLGFVTGAFSGSGKLSAAAFLFGFGSGLGYALYSIFSKFIIEKYDAMTITFYTFFVAAAVAVPMSGIIHNVEILFCVRGIIAAVGIAFLSTVLPFILYTKGLNNIEAGKASILATVEPLVAAVVGEVLYGEKFTITKIVGMLLIIIAVGILSFQGKNKKSQII